FYFLKVRTADRSRVGQDVPDVADAGEVHHQPFKAQAEARVLAGAVAPQVAVPPVVLGVHAQLPDAAFQDFQPLLALAAADDLADAGYQAVRRGHGFPIVVEAHVERLDLLGIIRDEHRLLVHLLGEIPLVFRLQVAAPGDLVVKQVVVLLQNRHCLGIGHPAEVRGGHVLQPLQQALVHEAVEKGQLLRALFHHLTDDELDHGLRHIHIALQVCEGHFRLDHPELGGVALGVGVLRPEGGAEGIYVPEGHGEVLRVQLAG
ncbi:DNA modification methylase, partial [Dysosmobacter welbionis]